ncbi:NADH:flavin oxidoreductase/NADH oxidase [Nocardiopsis sp. NPDC006198]|uniref:oxidoreductase n=1 Tax=Nocardiopsis sp. NPDC006198 TaxID=3154472 RepID=UPI0033B617CC
MNATTTGLFAPLRLREVELPTRVGMAPMSQYQADPATHTVTGWHLPHYAARARAGLGPVMVEATGISPQGLVTPHDLGLWDHTQQKGLADVATAIAAAGAVPALQLSHGGRKASRTRPWDGDAHLRPDQGGWEVIGPSPLSFAPGYALPRPATTTDLEQVLADFARSARLALEAGYRMIELHAGHGRLLHSFLSPLANQRTDRYGGAFTHRIRLLVETVEAVRQVWPGKLPLAVRLSCEDVQPGGWSMDDTLALVPILARAGVDLIDCSSGGIRRPQQRRTGPGFQVPYAAAIRERTGVATAAVGQINDTAHAEHILFTGQADLVLLGRALLTHPQLTLASQAAQHLVPPSYRRAHRPPAGEHLPEL